MNKNLHNSVLYIDMGQLRRNAEAILRELDGAQLIPVLKGNAYGLGLEKVGAALADIPEIRTMAVAQVSEGAALRQAGVTQDILVLGGVPEPELAFEPVTLEEDGKATRVVYRPQRSEEAMREHRRLSEKYQFFENRPREVLEIGRAHV